jgi:hypothetical protein
MQRHLPGSSGNRRDRSISKFTGNLSCDRETTLTRARATVPNRKSHSAVFTNVTLLHGAQNLPQYQFARDRIYPFFEGVLLANVNSLAMRSFVKYISKLAPATIRDYSNIAKAIVASAVNAQGDELFPRTWKEEFIDTPIVQYQRQPSTDKAGMEAILKEATGQYRMLYALLAGCGPLRAGEARHYSALDKDAEWNTGPVRRRSDWQGRGSLHKAGRNAAELYWLAHIRSSVLYVDGQPTPASKYAPGQPSSHPEED